MLKSLYGAAVVAACLNISAMDKTPQEFSGAPETSKTEMRHVPLSELEKISLLSSEEELENYYSTWNETLSLEDNLIRLCQCFLDTCCWFLAENCRSTMVEKSVKVEYNGVSQAKIDLFVGTLHQVSHNPVGCELIRLLLTKYLSDTTASRLPKAYIVSADREDKFCFEFSPGMTHNSCIIPVSDSLDDVSFMYAGMGEKLAQQIREKGGSINQIDRFHGMFFFNEHIGHCYDIVLFHTMLSWFHYVSGVDIESLTRSVNVTLKRYVQANLFPNRSALNEGLLSDYYFRHKFGLVYDKTSDSMKMDLLNESSYALARSSVIPVLLCSTSNEADVDFIRSFGDKELFEFYLTKQAKLPVFGVGQYKVFHKKPL